VVSGIFVCVGTIGGGTPVGAALIVAGIYAISDGISSMAQRNATGNLEAKVDIALGSSLPPIAGIHPDIVKAAVAEMGKVLAAHVPPGPAK
jgi:hypothetical protein